MQRRKFDASSGSAPSADIASPDNQAHVMLSGPHRRSHANPNPFPKIQGNSDYTPRSDAGDTSRETTHLRERQPERPNIHTYDLEGGMRSTQQTHMGSTSAYTDTAKHRYDYDGHRSEAPPPPSYSSTYHEYDRSQHTSGPTPQRARTQPILKAPVDNDHQWVFYGHEGGNQPVKIQPHPQPPPLPPPQPPPHQIPTQPPLRLIRAAISSKPSSDVPGTHRSDGGTAPSHTTSKGKSRRSQKKGTTQTVQNKMKMFQYHWKIDKPMVNSFPLTVAPHPGQTQEATPATPGRPHAQNETTKYTVTHIQPHRSRSPHPRSVSRGESYSIDPGEPYDQASGGVEVTRPRASAYTRPESPYARPPTNTHTTTQPVAIQRLRPDENPSHYSTSYSDRNMMYRSTLDPMDYDKEHPMGDTAVRLGASAPEYKQGLHPKLLREAQRGAYASSNEGEDLSQERDRPISRRSSFDVNESDEQLGPRSEYNADSDHNLNVTSDEPMTPLQMLLISVDRQLVIEGQMMVEGSDGAKDCRGSRSTHSSQDVALEVQSALRGSSGSDPGPIGGVTKMRGRRTPTGGTNRHRRAQSRKLATPIPHEVLLPIQSQSEGEQKRSSGSGSETDSM